MCIYIYILFNYIFVYLYIYIHIFKSWKSRIFCLPATTWLAFLNSVPISCRLPHLRKPKQGLSKVELHPLEASKGGMKVGRIKDPLYKDSYFGITPPTFIPPFEAAEPPFRRSEASKQGLGFRGLGFRVLNDLYRVESHLRGLLGFLHFHLPQFLLCKV